MDGGPTSKREVIGFEGKLISLLSDIECLAYSGQRLGREILKGDSDLGVSMEA